MAVPQAWWVVVEGLVMTDVVFGPYATEEEAVQAMQYDSAVEATCCEDCGDCYVQLGLPEHFREFATGVVML